MADRSASAAAVRQRVTLVSYPAGYASVMSVGALDVTETFATFSQHNSDVEISAPGVAVESTTPWISNASITVGATSYTGHGVEGAASGTASVRTRARHSAAPPR